MNSKWIWIWCPLVLILGIVIFVRSLPLYQAEGHSMEPTIQDGDIYYVEKKETLYRGDIVVFQSEKEGFDFIKRVIALGGETIEIKNNQVLINGKELPEPYISKNRNIPDMESIQVPDGHVFVLGDVRTDSYDSRQMGSIPTSDIIGFITSKKE